MQLPGLELALKPGSQEQHLRATLPHEPGSVLCVFSGIPGPRSRHSVQVGIDRCVELQPPVLRYLSHSCSPNLFLDMPTWQIKVLTRIEVGDELSVFYPSFEWEMLSPFDCWCGSPQCLRRIAGARFLSPEVLARYQLAPHIAETARGDR
jgi:hypothetical protein